MALFKAIFTILFFCGNFCPLHCEGEPTGTSDVSKMKIYYEVLAELEISKKTFFQLTIAEAQYVILRMIDRYNTLETRMIDRYNTLETRMIDRYNTLETNCNTLNNTYKELLVNSEAQARLEFLRSMCPAPKGNSVENTWLNILQESNSPHATELRYRIKREGLTFNTFARYAAEIEKIVNEKRHPPQSKLRTKKEMDEVLEILAPEESVKSTLAIILIPFTDEINHRTDKDGLFATFTCLVIRKIPGGVKMEKIKDVVHKKVPYVNLEDIYFKFAYILDENGRRRFMGEGFLCFIDHETADTFWRDTSRLELEKYKTVGFAPVEGTKESLCFDYSYV